MAAKERKEHTEKGRDFLQKATKITKWLTEDGAFGIGEFFVAAVVAAGVDEGFGGGEVGGGGFPGILRLAEEEAGAVEADVGLEESHGAAFGDFPSFV
jgi:hypothetical protein